MNREPMNATYEAFSLKTRPAIAPRTSAIASFTGILSFFLVYVASLMIFSSS